MSVRNYTLTFASGATGTNKVFIGSHNSIVLVASAMTGYNAAVGNATMTIRGGLSESDTHADIASNFISTHTIKGVYPMSLRGSSYLSVGFATAVTGSAANTIDVIVYDAH